jgi:hypothetical protein
MGWAELVNGKLLEAAELDGFAALITVDKGFATQQNMAGCKISVIIMEARSTELEVPVPVVPELLNAIKNLNPGEIIRVSSQ